MTSYESARILHKHIEHITEEAQQKIENIRADIEQELNRDISGNDKSFIEGLKCAYGECLAIIDNYMDK